MRLQNTRDLIKLNKKNRKKLNMRGSFGFGFENVLTDQVVPVLAALDKDLYLGVQYC